jgi:hypothetical protein
MSHGAFFVFYEFILCVNNFEKKLGLGFCEERELRLSRDLSKELIAFKRYRHIKSRLNFISAHVLLQDTGISFRSSTLSLMRGAFMSLLP